MGVDCAQKVDCASGPGGAIRIPATIEGAVRSKGVDGRGYEAGIISSVCIKRSGVKSSGGVSSQMTAMRIQNQPCSVRLGYEGGTKAVRRQKYSSMASP